MTGYGRATQRVAGGSITVELRSTNHRYLEIDQRLPNGLMGLQERVAERIRERIRRGRVEVAVGVQLDRWNQRKIAFDERLLQRYYAALTELKGRFGLQGPVTLDHLLALPQAITIVEERLPVEQLWEALRAATGAATQELERSRRREGAKLVGDLRRQTRRIEQHLRAITQRLPKALAQQRQRVREQLKGLLGPGAAASAAQLKQVAALLEEVDVHEEFVRLESHLGYIRSSLGGQQLIGKRLDFIAQELMREANTMGAKVNDPIAAQHVVEIKGCIEKIREQVQNLE